MNQSNNAITDNSNTTVQNNTVAAATQAQVNEVLEMLERILTAQERLESLVLSRTSGTGNMSSSAKANLLDV